MSVYEDIQRNNALHAEEQRKANEDHMAEMMKKNTAIKVVIVQPVVEYSVQGAWKKRAARWKKF
jgi:hypothetical protein